MPLSCVLTGPTELAPAYGSLAEPTELAPTYGSLAEPTELAPAYGSLVEPTELAPAYGSLVEPTELAPAYGSLVEPTELAPAYGSLVKPIELAPISTSLVLYTPRYQRTLNTNSQSSFFNFSCLSVCLSVCACVHRFCLLYIGVIFNPTMCFSIETVPERLTVEKKPCCAIKPCATHTGVP